MTHEESRQRHARIATAVLGGRRLADVAKDEGISYSGVYRACRLRGVTYRDRRLFTQQAIPPPLRTVNTINRAFAVLYELQLREKTLRQIAEQFDTTSQRVSQIEEMALNANLLAPRSKSRTEDKADG